MQPSSRCVTLVPDPPLQTSEDMGIKMTIRRLFAGNSSEQTIYLLGDRKRVEFRNYAGQQMADGSQEWLSGPRLAAITRCDLRQFFELNLDAAEYVSAPYPPKPLTRGEIETLTPGKQNTSLSSDPTLRIETDTMDTGERKNFFGHVARHVVVTRKQIPLKGSHSEPQVTVTDGWYIDLDTRVSCDRTRGEHGHGNVVIGNQRTEKLELVDIGESETGFAVQLTMVSKGTYTLPNGTSQQADSRSERLVTQLELGSVDPRLFEIPRGFKHVDHIERNPRPSTSLDQTTHFWGRLKSRLTRVLNL